MTIEQADKIDGIGIDKRLNELTLLVSDHLPWEDEAAHFRAMESKIDAYLNYLRSNQHLESIPQSKGLPIRINLLCEHSPTQNAQSILEGMRGQLESMNIRFSYDALPSGY